LFASIKYINENGPHSDNKRKKTKLEPKNLFILV